MFLRVKCDCGEERIVFDKTTKTITCSNCDDPLAHNTGGKAVIHGEVIEELD